MPFCSEQGCVAVAKERGLCCGHGGYKRCSAEGCTERRSKYGYCTAHAREFGAALCSVDGCTLRKQKHGKCTRHFKLALANGEHQCAYTGCTEAQYGNYGVCREHFSSKPAVPVSLPAELIKICIQDGCGRMTVGDGDKCGMHNENGRVKRKRDVPQRPPAANPCEFEGGCVRSKVKRSKLCRGHLNMKGGCNTKGCEGEVLFCGWCRPCATEKERESKQGEAQLCLTSGGWLVAVCKVDGCDITAQAKGLCAGHGGKRGVCTERGCRRKARREGKCNHHGGLVECVEEGCDNARSGRLYCSKHDKSLHCECGKRAVNCEIHHRPGTTWCITCGDVNVRGAQHCARCRREHHGIAQRIEHQYLDKLKSWGFIPTTTDRVITDSETCEPSKTIEGKPNRSRADYFYLLPDPSPYNIVVECDEHQHTGYDPLCEKARLHRLADQVIANQGKVKPLLVIRFNPHCRTPIDDELKQTMSRAVAGGYKINNLAGIETIFIGYK